MKALIYIFLFLICGFALAAGQVEINTATLEQLDEITGIGPALGQRIIDARPYSSIDDLLKVKGIGEKTLQKIKDQGLAYVEGQSPNPTTSPTPAIPSPQTTENSSQLSGASIINGIIISEIMPSPNGPDEANEWIKIMNLNDFEADLSGWQIKDTNGKTTTYIFPKNSKIPGKGFLVLTRPETKISLNNDADGLELIKPDGAVADSVGYEKALTGQSYIRIANAWQWKTNLEKKEGPSPNNQISNESPDSLSTQANIKEIITKETPDFSSRLRRQAWIIATLTAVCSSATILFLKIKLNAIDKSGVLG